MIVSRRLSLLILLSQASGACFSVFRNKLQLAVRKENENVHHFKYHNWLFWFTKHLQDSTRKHEDVSLLSSPSLKTRILSSKVYKYNKHLNVTFPSTYNKQRLGACHTVSEQTATCCRKRKLTTWSFKIHYSVSQNTHTSLPDSTRTYRFQFSIIKGKNCLVRKKHLLKL
jgi:hypothetical protein